MDGGTKLHGRIYASPGKGQTGEIALRPRLAPFLAHERRLMRGANSRKPCNHGQEARGDASLER